MCAGSLLLTHPLQPGPLRFQVPDPRFCPGPLLSDRFSHVLEGFWLLGVLSGPFLYLLPCSVLGQGFLPCPHLCLLPNDGLLAARPSSSATASCAAASIPRLSQAAAACRPAAALSAAEMAAAAELWAAMPFSQWEAPFLGDEDSSVHSIILLRGQVSAHAQIAGHAAGALSTAGHLASMRDDTPAGGRGPSLRIDPTSLLGPERFRGSRRRLALDLHATAMKSPRAAAPGSRPPLVRLGALGSSVSRSSSWRLGLRVGTYWLSRISTY